MFEFSEEHLMLKNTVQKLVDNEFGADWARRIDEEDRFPKEVLKKFAELDLLGVTVDEEYGGTGRDLIAATIICEELARRSIALAWVYVGAVFFGAEIISKLGSEEQKKKVLPGIVNGEYILSYALTEPNAGSDTASVQTSAHRSGDGYFINGSKIFISGAGNADYIILLTRTDNTVKKHKGLTFFLVSGDEEGISTSPISKLGVHGSDTCEIVFDNVKAGAGDILGGEEKLNQGWQQLLSTLDVEHIHLAAEGVGLARGAWEEAERYVKQREQFGQTISKFQVIQHKMADLYTEIEAARLLTYSSASLAQKGKPCWRESTMAKLYATEVAKKTALEGLQLHGGYGYTMEYDIQRYTRDSLVLTIGGGTSEALKNIIAKSLDF